MRSLVLTCCFAFLLLAPFETLADDVPAKSTVKPTPPAPAKSAAKPELPAPIYDEKADAQALIRQAVDRAKKENRRVLVQWGANWCPWCHVLHTALKTDKELARKMLYEYDLVLVDVGRRTKNMDLAAHYGVDLTKNGIPYLTILDRNGAKLVNQPTDDFEKSDKKERGYETAKLLDFLKKHQASYLSAETVFNSALEEVKHSGKHVFLHIGAPWCGWCKRLEAWLAQPDIAKIMGQDYVELKIDEDRMSGGKELYHRYCPKPEGIPWMAVLDAEGKALITSDGPKGNIGYPGDPEEIVHFMKMIETTRHKITEQEAEHLRESLTVLGKKYTQRQTTANTK